MAGAALSVSVIAFVLTCTNLTVHNCGRTLEKWERVVERSTGMVLQAAEEHRTSRTHPPRPRQQAGPSALVVDDDPVLVECIANARRQVGWQARAACGGRAALAELAASNFDVALLDVDMPDVDGWEVLRAIHAQPHPPAVLMMSGFASGSDARSHAADWLLAKPFTLAQLLEALSWAAPNSAARAPAEAS